MSRQRISSIHGHAAGRWPESASPARRTARLVAAFLLAALLSGHIPASAPRARAARTSAALTDGGRCPPLPDPDGKVILVSTVSELQDAVSNLASGTTILVADGEYELTHTLVIGGGVQDVAVRGASGDRGAVVLRGQGMTNPDYGSVPHGFLIQDAVGVLIADLTIRDAYYHNIQIQGEQGAQAVRLYNLHLIDSGEQFVKVSTAGPPGPYADDGVVECSLIEYTDRARSWYTNGVDVLAGAGWVIRDNVFRNIRAPEGELAGPAVLVWRNSLDTIVERNLFLECDRAIALGLSAPDGNSRDGETVYDHQGGVIRNNFLYRAGDGDVGITVNYARDFKIYHNTVIQNGTFPWGTIEYRFPASSGEIRFNLSDGPIWERDGATAVLEGNLTAAEPGWFVDAAAGDLHLDGSVLAAIDQALPLAEVADDYDGEPRPIGVAPDVGADEYGVPAPGAAADLRVAAAITDTTVLTVTLTWTPPAGALTTTLRYAGSPIGEENWAGATSLAEALPGDTGQHTAALPYTGGTLYFALKTQNAAGEWSPISNNAYWPEWWVYLAVLACAGAP